MGNAYKDDQAAGAADVTQPTMRRSRVLEKLRAGGIATCTKMNLADPRATQIASMWGFDCVWLDMEHVPPTLANIEAQINVAKCYDVDPLVRVKRGAYSDFIYPLEADAAGIMVPHCMSLDDAREIVYQTRFHPLGRRAIDGGNADGAYCMIPGAEYIKTANEQRFVMVQIEDPEVLDDLDAICQLDGIDIIFYGPGDFTQGIGAPFQFDHPKIAETRRLVADTANKYGKIAGTIGAPDALQSFVDIGYRFLSSGADVVALGLYYQELISSFRELKLPS